VRERGFGLRLGSVAIAGPRYAQRWCGSQINPTTINNSCADGTSGTFHSDESNDRLVVQTTDGSNLAPGKTVKVSATVWAYSGFTSDHLDLYYAANAGSPSWVLIGTITPTAAGAQDALGQLHSAQRQLASSPRAIPLPGKRIFLHHGLLQRS